MVLLVDVEASESSAEVAEKANEVLKTRHSISFVEGRKCTWRNAPEGNFQPG